MGSKLMRSLPQAMLMMYQVVFAFSALPVIAFDCPRSQRRGEPTFLSRLVAVAASQCEAPARAGVEEEISPPRLKLDIRLTCVRVRQPG